VNSDAHGNSAGTLADPTRSADPSSINRGGRGRTVRIAIGIATVAYLVWLIVAHFGEINRAVVRFQGAATRWLIAAVAFEVVSQACSVVMEHRLLRHAGSTMGLAATSRLVLAQNAIGLAVPGGPAFASVFSYRHIRRRGANAAAAAWVVAATSTVGMLALATWGAFTATGTSWITVLAASLLVVVLAVIVLLARSPQRVRSPWIRLVQLTDWLWRRRGHRPSADVRVDQRVAKLGAVRLGWRDWLFVAGFALAAVAADFAVWLCASHAVIALPSRCLTPGLTGSVAQRCAAFHPATTAGLLVAYSAGQAVLVLPLVPGGIGLVESLMTATLTATKVRAIQALSAVLLYRLISVGGVVAVGGVIWLTLRRDRRGAVP
jgi:putative heme transporter